MRSLSRLRPQWRRSDGFSLIEVMVTLAILLVVMVAVLEFMTEVDHAFKVAAADPFAEAEDAFSAISRNLASATLAPYEDYADTSGSFRVNAAFVPDHLARRSDLAFVCSPASGTGGLLTASGRTTTGSGIFFVAPNGYTQNYAHAGMEHLLNAMGYFVEFGDYDSAPSFTLSHSWRWRLKQILQPTESLQVFNLGTSPAWIQQIVPAGASVPVLAENVVTLIVLPECAANDSGPILAPAFNYDSRDTTNRLTLHQLPPRVRVVLVAIDKPSAARLAQINGSNPPQLVATSLFQQAPQLDADLATLDGSLATQKIGHRIFQREIQLPSSNWSGTPSP